MLRWLLLDCKDCTSTTHQRTARSPSSRRLASARTAHLDGVLIQLRTYLSSRRQQHPVDLERCVASHRLSVVFHFQQRRGAASGATGLSRTTWRRSGAGVWFARAAEARRTSVRSRVARAVSQP